MKRLLVLAFSILSLNASAASGRLTRAFDSIPDKQSAIKDCGTWISYPDYADRKAWDEFGGPFKKSLTKLGDKYLNYEWELQRASSYLEYEKTGNRELMRPEEHNRAALNYLIMAELADGNGKYLMQIVDGVWFLCQQYSWAHGQHTSMQDSHRTLPRYDDAVVSLHNSSTGASLAMAYHFFKDEFDKLDPSINETLRREVRRQIITPYLDEKKDENHWWFCFKDTGHAINNWDPFCNFNSLLCILTMDCSREETVRAMQKCCRSVDIYLDNVKQDGACDEGPGYWGMSCGTVYDLLRLLYDATSGQIDIFSDDLIRRMGEFKAKTYFGDGWVMDYGDGTARDLGNVAQLYRYGKDCKSEELINFGISLLANADKGTFTTPSADPPTLTGGTFRSLETMKYYPALKEDEAALLKKYGNDWNAMQKGIQANVKSEVYPLTEYGILRKGGWTLAAKGGHNAESHNHNDVGSAILMVDMMPVLIDPGVGEYTKETFSNERYNVWTMQSGWHNLPVINGVMEHKGAEYKAEGSVTDLKKSSFTTDIHAAYPEEAACKSWKRTYTLTDKSLAITDKYTLSKRVAPDEEHFIIWGEVTESKPGMLIIRTQNFKKTQTAEFKLEYPKSLSCRIEEKACADKKLERVWGKSLRRIILTSPQDAALSGSYTFRVTPVK